MARISIGLPVFNGEPYLRQALEAIRSQTQSDIEIIISDNSSTDNTQDICMRYASIDSRIKYIRQDRNIGPLANFAHVFQCATSDYFAWAAADDLMSKFFVERLLGVIEADDSIACVMSDIIVHDEVNGDRYLELLSQIHLPTIKGVQDNRRHFFKVPTSNIYFCIYGVYRRSVLGKVDMAGSGGFVSGQEIPILAQVACLGKIVGIPEQLFEYRRHVQSAYHQEQRQTNRWRAILQHINLAGACLLIAAKSELPVWSKLDCMWTTFSTATTYIFQVSLRWLMRLLGIRL